MNIATRFFNNIAYTPWIIAISMIGGLVSFLWFIYERINGLEPSYYKYILIIITFSVFCIVSGYSFLVRKENSALRDMAKYIHEINHDYRNALRDMFVKGATTINRDNLMLAEAETIKSVCQKIGKIYSRLIGKECTVTVKLITEENKKTSYCTTYARSELNSDRDSTSPSNFEIGTGKNLAFDTALRYSPISLSYFFSADLPKDHKEGRYTNERQHFNKFYKSAIVVPIRCIPKNKNEKSDDIGFLSIDTMSRNRLNNTFHHVLLAAFADQMYNFFGLTRGTYKISSEVKQEKNKGNSKRKDK